MPESGEPIPVLPYDVRRNLGAAVASAVALLGLLVIATSPWLDGYLIELYRGLVVVTTIGLVAACVMLMRSRQPLAIVWSHGMEYRRWLGYQLVPWRAVRVSRPESFPSGRSFPRGRNGAERYFVTVRITDGHRRRTLRVEALPPGWDLRRFFEEIKRLSESRESASGLESMSELRSGGRTERGAARQRRPSGERSCEP